MRHAGMPSKVKEENNKPAREKCYE